ncbi:transcription initiation factor TFIID subunit 6 [Trichomonascus vanleenenianus]|uniref:TATA-binding protein-associated factor TAF6 n=1 Tax=Trichomonascus vanleenenianus TaxID=2268995 RepID=UPI003EC985FC
MDIEYRIHEIVEQALKFMRHSKRTTLTTNDISQALRVLNVEPLYGYESSAPLSYREALVGPGQTLYYIDEDEDVDFEKIINQPLPKVPRAVSFTAHWLAIEGVQPAIPQNPQESEVKAILPQLRGAMGGSSITAVSQDMDVKPLVKHVISKELQLYFDRMVAALVADENEESSASMKNSALSSLRNDPGLHQLVPYFVQFVQEKVSENLKSNTAILDTMLLVVDALLTNPTIFIEPYIHHIMPSVLTVLLAKRVGPKPVTQESYRLRDSAASLLNNICERFGDTYHTLKPRVTRTLLKGFMDTTRPVGALYGAVVGIQALGAEIVRVVIMGNIKSWYEGVLPRIEREEDREMISNAVVNALRTLKLPEKGLVAEIDEDKLKAKIGEELSIKLSRVEDGKDIARGILHGEL